jgi:hypothetical protein
LPRREAGFIFESRKLQADPSGLINRKSRRSTHDILDFRQGRSGSQFQGFENESGLAAHRSNIAKFTHRRQIFAPPLPRYRGGDSFSKPWNCDPDGPVEHRKAVVG